MNYPCDPEIAAAIPLIPQSDLTDLPAARGRMAEMFQEEQAAVDETGVTAASAPESTADSRNNSPFVRSV
ncbi:hypothetical protein ATK36_0381 [Amycolatopsis sulphurea]|uniref:Uncharacterized protein n=1 Tax=Amycolatopsis sulphurea TaxID=76022 RepID=A0A2A9G2G2_9PSEU|nr:hypothetical protein [Amycolatopsis sulphurea]PFG56849.1 hypothetical protein ATK36_0381 [Amycolatopsis sulphurea]